MKRNACQKCVFAVYDDNPHCGLRGFTTSFNVEWCESENDKAPNGYELQEDGYFSWVNKKKYPKTYEKCAEIIAEFIGSDCNPKGCMGYMSTQLTAFQKLLICRDTYWKLYGEEMGLRKPWEPDWTDHEFKYCIKVLGNTLECVSEMNIQCILAFPTKEMRDAFFENFKELIESCKELL